MKLSFLKKKAGRKWTKLLENVCHMISREEFSSRKKNAFEEWHPLSSDIPLLVPRTLGSFYLQFHCSQLPFWPHFLSYQLRSPSWIAIWRINERAKFHGSISQHSRNLVPSAIRASRPPNNIKYMGALTRGWHWERGWHSRTRYFVSSMIIYQSLWLWVKKLIGRTMLLCPWCREKEKELQGIVFLLGI